MSGYTHLYTGNGKGKTTAAIGLALRAVGAGKKVYIAQFVKGLPYAEHKAIDSIDGIELDQFGRSCFIDREPTSDDIEAARKGLQHVHRIIRSKSYDMVILDEICIAIHYNLIDQAEVIETVKNKPEETELILTGRYARSELCDIADLVTEMVEIKHYYKTGVEARKGVEY